MGNDEDSLPLYSSAVPLAKIEMTSSSTSQSQPQQQQPPMPPPVQPPVILGPDNTVTVCHFCRACVKTSVRHTTTTRTHIAAALCWFTCCCCCLPYCLNSGKNSDHYCPNCHKYLGTYER